MASRSLLSCYPRCALVSIVVKAVQDALEIAAAVKYPDNHNFAGYDFECNGNATLKTDGPQPGADVVSAGAPSRSIF